RPPLRPRSGAPQNNCRQTAARRPGLDKSAGSTSLAPVLARYVRAMARTSWLGPSRWSSRFAGRWVILAVATRLTRLAGWLILNSPQPGIWAPGPDPDLICAQF